MKNYTMTTLQLTELISACKPTPAIALHCGCGPSPQEMANAFWKKLGDEMGFDSTTVKPTGMGNKSFKAEEL